MRKTWTEQGWDDYLYWQTQDKKTLRRINDLVKDIERNGIASGIGKPEPLKGDLQGFWSRRSRRLPSPPHGDALLSILCDLSIHDNKRMGETKMTRLLSGAAGRPVSPDGRAANGQRTHHRRRRDASDLLDSRAACFGTQSRCSATESGKCPMSVRSAPHGTRRLAEGS